MLEFGSVSGLLAALFAVFLVVAEEALLAKASLLSLFAALVASFLEEAFLSVLAEFLSALQQKL